MKIKASGILIAAITSVFITQSAFATDGTITINGAITDTTCGVSVNNGTNDATVTLPTISSSALGSANAVAGTTPFTIALTGCTGSTLSNAYAHFESGATVETATGRLNNSGSAANVQVRLLNKNSLPIFVGSASQSDVREDISTGSATLNYYAQYFTPNGSVGPGTVAAQVEYTMIYD